MIFPKLKKFLDLDIRWKLKKIGRILNINLYPEKFYKTGWKSIYTKIIFYLIFKEKSKIIFRKNFDLIFNKTLFADESNLLVALPRSGSNFLRNLIITYISLEKKISNGVPKYDGYTDRWKTISSTIFSDNLYNSISLDDEQFKILNILNEDELKKKIIFFSRHPIQNSDLININNKKTILLLRTPREQIKSWILTKSFFYKYTNQEFKNQLDIIIKSNIKFLKFWNDNFKNLKYKGLIVIFDELSINTETLFREILKFYKYDLNEKNILKTIEINNKDNYRAYFGEKDQSIRFMNNEIKNKYLKQYEDYVFDNKIIYEAEEYYKKLISIKSTGV